MEEGEQWVHNSYVHPSLEVKKALNGRGMFVKDGHSIKKDEVLVVWTGRIVTLDVVQALQPPDDDYFLQVYDHLFQVPFELGKREPADFVNHSCEPNGGLRGEAVLVAMRDLSSGEEITFDYATTECLDEEWECLCGAPTCRGIIRGTDWKNPALWRKYGEYWSLYLLRKIEALKKEEKLS